MAFKIGNDIDLEADFAARQARQREEKAGETIVGGTFAALLLLHGLPHDGFTLDMVDVLTEERVRIVTTYWTDDERARFLANAKVATAVADQNGSLTLTLRGHRKPRHGFEAHFAEIL